MALAFARVGYGPFRRVARMLSSRYRRHLGEAEEAVQDTLLDLYVKRRSLFREDPENWLALLYSLAKFRLMRVETGQGRTNSIEALSELGGDAPLIGAEPCIPISMDAEEERRYGRLPARNEDWSRGQMIGAAQRFRDHYGHPPKIADCKAINRLPSPSAIYRVFTSFDELILAAGMTPERLGQRRRRWSPVEAAKVCASFKSRHGDWPCWSDVKRYPGELPSTNVMIRFFGSTRSAEVGLGAEAILAAGESAL